jgi:hypothetical protein
METLQFDVGFGDPGALQAGFEVGEVLCWRSELEDSRLSFGEKLCGFRFG